MNYTEIIDMALSFADREYHAKIVSRIDNLLRLVESRINRRLKREGLTDQVDIAIIGGTEYYNLPSNFNGISNINIRATAGATTRQTLVYRTVEKLSDYANIAETNDVVYYTIVNNKLQIIPTPDGKVIDLIYYIKIPELTSVATENDISTNDPDCYIFGLLVEINSFVKDKDAAAIWDSRFNAVLDEMNMNDFKHKYLGAQLTIVPDDSF